MACGGFEGFTKIYFGVKTYQPFFSSFHLLFPDSYTISEALKTLRASLPILLQAGLFLMDNTFDILPIQPEDPLEILKAITNRQTELIATSEGILKKAMQENYFT